MIFIKYFFTDELYDHIKVMNVYLTEGDKVDKCYSCLKLIIQAHLHVVFFTIIL